MKRTFVPDATLCCFDVFQIHNVLISSPECAEQLRDTFLDDFF